MQLQQRAGCERDVGMAMLIMAAIVFLAIHFLISGTRLRDGITALIGERPYLALFSLASLVAIGWLAASYNTAAGGEQDRVFYDLGPGVRYAAIPATALAFLLGVQGLLAPNPTSVQQERAAVKRDTIRGVLRITRHPFLWGVVIWSAVHVAANGNLASVIFFGTFLVLAFFGTFSIDRKRRRKLGTGWDPFSAVTSNLPFAAVLTGRNSLNIGESFGWRFWAATLIFLIALFAHTWLFRASPFPSGWVPF
jgi:uncharacterized membrane protein